MSSPLLFHCALLLSLFLLGGAHAQVFRCGSTYSDEPCKGAKVIDASPVVSDPSGPRTKEIYLCRAPQGGLYWTAEHCVQRGWTIERIQRVPANVSWNDQVAAGRSQKAEAEAMAAAPPVQTYSAPSPQASTHAKNAACPGLDDRVNMLDSMGRAGSRYYDLDWVRRERKEARDQQHRLRC